MYFWLACVEETVKLNEETSNFIEKIEEDKQNGVMDMEIEESMDEEKSNHPEEPPVIRIVDEVE